MSLTAEYVSLILEYDQLTGVFKWKYRADATSRWNGRYSGKNAGSIGSTGHVRICINDKMYLAHRLAWLMIHGVWPANEIDHINGEPSDNRLVNLREATRQENQQNRRRHCSNKSGLKGIYKNKIGTTWAATIYWFGRKIHVGNFPTAEAAHAAYCAAARNHYGEFARTS